MVNQYLHEQIVQERLQNIRDEVARERLAAAISPRRILRVRLAEVVGRSMIVLGKALIARTQPAKNVCATKQPGGFGGAKPL